MMQLIEEHPEIIAVAMGIKGVNYVQVSDAVGCSKTAVLSWVAGRRVPKSKAFLLALVRYFQDEIEEIAERENLLPDLERKDETVPLTRSGWSDIPLSTAAIPLLGKIPAGRLNLATVEVTKLIHVPIDERRAEHCFALRISGQSMEAPGRENIPDGAIAIFEQREWRNGDVCAVRYGDECACKRVYHYGHMIRLQPNNPAFDVIDLPIEDVEIMGVIIGMYVERL